VQVSTDRSIYPPPTHSLFVRAGDPYARAWPAGRRSPGSGRRARRSGHAHVQPHTTCAPSAPAMTCVHARTARRSCSCRGTIESERGSQPAWAWQGSSLASATDRSSIPFGGRCTYDRSATYSHSSSLSQMTAMTSDDWCGSTRERTGSREIIDDVVRATDRARRRGEIKLGVGAGTSRGYY